MRWPSVKLPDICRPKQWPTIPKNKMLSSGYPVYGANGRIGYYSEYNHEKPTVLITCRGATCGAINVCQQRSYVTGNAMALDELDRSLVDLHFLSRVLQVADFSNVVTGVAQPQITRQSLERLQIPLPPLAEQKRIAAILDVAHALRAKRRESLAQLDALVQSTFLEMFGDPGSNSKNFPTCTLGELGDWHSGGTPPRKNLEYFAGTIPWFSSGELEEMYIYESSERITEAAIKETAAKTVPAGALMLGMYDTAALKAAFAGIDCSCNQAIAFSLLRNKISNPVYVYLAITIGREHFRRLRRGIRQKNLNLSMIREIRIPIPLLDLQHRIAAVVESIEQQKALQRTHLAELDALFASLQHRAFAGELSSEDAERVASVA